MDTERRSITRPDGRNIDFLIAGPADGLPLVLHEGTPVGLVLYPPTVRRPGYAGCGSSWPPGPATRARRRGRAGAWWTWPRTPPRSWTSSARTPSSPLGWSGGGPHALACAAALPGRCLAAASIAGVAPYQAKGLDWLAGMGPENIAEFGAAVHGEAALTAFLEHEAVTFSTLTGESVAESLGGLVIEADQAVLTGEFADHVAAALRASMNSGIAGWRDDDFAFVKDWGFSLGWEHSPGQRRRPPPAPARPPVAVWQGDQDRMVPFAHGQWLAANIRGARAHLMPGDGHLSMTVSAFDRILDDLLDLAGLTHSTQKSAPTALSAQRLHCAGPQQHRRPTSARRLARTRLW